MSKKHVLIGNGININFGGRDYTNGQIIERLSMKLKHNDGYRGPHYYLMRIEGYANMPLAFYEILILLYLKGTYSVQQVIEIFNAVIEWNPELPYNLRSIIEGFVRRFIATPYTQRDKNWFIKFCTTENISYKKKLKQLKDAL